MTADIECPKCDRIDFEFDTHMHCAVCGWTIRPPQVENPYGHDVLIVIRDYTNGLTRREVRHFKGNQTRVRNAAKRVTGYSRVAALVPLTEAEWIRAYGEGKM